MVSAAWSAISEYFWDFQIFFWDSVFFYGFSEILLLFFQCFVSRFGYGLMDGGALVNMAKTWKTVPEQHICTYEYRLANPKWAFLIFFKNNFLSKEIFRKFEISDIFAWIFVIFSKKIWHFFLNFLGFLNMNVTFKKLKFWENKISKLFKKFSV